MASKILGRIRNVYMDLHQGTDSELAQISPSTGNECVILGVPSSYPVCNIPVHHLDSTPHIHNVSAPATFACALPHDHNNTALVPSFFAATPSLSARAPLRVDESLADALPLDNNISVSVSLQPVAHVPATSSNPVTTRVTHGSTGTSARTKHLSTPEPSASTPPRPKASTSSPPDDVSVEHTPTHSLNVLSLPSPAQVLDDMLPTGSPSSSDSVVTGPNHASSSPASHSLMLAPGAPDLHHP